MIVDRDSLAGRTVGLDRLLVDAAGQLVNDNRIMAS